MNNPLTNAVAQAPITRKTAAHIEIVGLMGPHRPGTVVSASSPWRLMQAALRQHYTEVGITRVNTMADLEALVAKKPDLVLLGKKLFRLDAPGRPKVWLPDYLAAHGINFTGSDAAALMLQFDKPAAKQAVLDAGLRSAAYCTVPAGQPATSHGLRFPLFVKPTNLGCSVGIDELSLVHTEAELQRKVQMIHAAYACDVLVEEYLPGREFSVAVIRQPRSDDLRTMPIEISSPPDAKGNTFLSGPVKAADIEKVFPVTDQALRNALHTFAVGAFKALGARDYGRIDIRLDADGAPCFIEANLMPGLSDHGYLRRCFAINEHASYEAMILSIVRLGLERRTAPLGLSAA